MLGLHFRVGDTGHAIYNYQVLSKTSGIIGIKHNI